MELFVGQTFEIDALDALPGYQVEIVFIDPGRKLLKLKAIGERVKHPHRLRVMPIAGFVSWIQLLEQHKTRQEARP